MSRPTPEQLDAAQAYAGTRVDAALVAALHTLPEGRPDVHLVAVVCHVDPIGMLTAIATTLGGQPIGALALQAVRKACDDELLRLGNEVGELPPAHEVLVEP